MLTAPLKRAAAWLRDIPTFSTAAATRSRSSDEEILLIQPDLLSQEES